MIAWALTIFIQSSFPAIELPKVEIISFDKVVHMGVFGVLAGLCYISLLNIHSRNILTNNIYLSAGILSIIYGATDEIHQYFVPNRSSEVQDWLADVVGIIIALLVIRYFLSKRFKLFSKSVYLKN
ncbi:MAG: VanZ like family protein [Chlorobi bacterium OLB5]|nr:MAG: VanZ like family protein [Chlorobi bacterium OLB5]